VSTISRADAYSIFTEVLFGKTPARLVDIEGCGKVFLEKPAVFAISGEAQRLSDTDIAALFQALLERAQIDETFWHPTLEV